MEPVHEKPFNVTSNPNQLTIAARSVSEAEKKIVAARAAWRCSSCDSLLASTYQIDHIKPLCEGGSNSISNLTALCVSCHARKTQLEAIDRAKRLRDRAIKEKIKAAADAREDYVVVRSGARVLQCQTCLRTRPLHEGWESHVCPKIYGI